jgi:ligand-binding sensor domain-containing protein/signal transduction histidine kinase
MKYLITCFLLLTGLFIAAQGPSIRFRNININEGLSQSSVVDIAIDPTGFLWLATQDGLNRFDAKDFIVFPKIFDDVTLPTGNRLGKVITGTNNDLWMITSGGKLERFDLYNQTFQQYKKLSKDSIALPPSSCIFLDQQNRLWIGTASNGLYVYSLKDDKLDHFSASVNSALQLADNHIQDIFMDKKKNYWVLTTNGINHINAALSSIQYFHPENDARSVSGVSFSSIDEDEEGTLWAGSFGKGLFFKNETDSVFHPFKGFPNALSLPTDLVVYTVKTDRDGKLWVGTYSNGLYLIDKKNHSIEVFQTDKRKAFSYAHNDVLCIKRDQKGGVWIGTDGGGLSYYHAALGNFSIYYANNIPDNVSIEQVRSIVIDHDGRVWAGTSEKGIFCHNPVNGNFSQFTLDPYKPGLTNPNRIVALFCDPDGDIWIGTQTNGLLVLDAATGRIKQWWHPDGSGKNHIPNPTTWCMQPVNNRQVLVGSGNHGLLVIDKQKGLVAAYNELSSPGLGNVRAITPVNDSLFLIGSERKGIRLFNTSTKSFSDIPGASTHQIWNGETILKSMFYRAPYILIGTQGNGLLVFDSRSGKTQRIGAAHGLPNNTIYSIVEDNAGYLWLSTNKGICRFDLPPDPASVHPGLFDLYNVEDGLQSNEFNTGAWYRHTDGTIYFGGVKGLNYFNPSHFVKSSEEIPVVITQINVKNNPYTSDTVISYKKTLKLKHDENSVSFTYAGLDFLSRAGLQYFYRLNGYDDKWINAGQRNYAAYTNLMPGEYSFEVKAFSQSMNGFGPVTKLAIRVIPPFWQTWWFIAAAILAVIAAVYALYRYRIRQVMAMQNIRSRIATDLHDDIGSTLTNINILSELSKKNLHHEKEANLFLNRIAEEVNISSQALDDIVWSINKDNDTIEQTVARMRRYASEVFDNANIYCTMQADEHISARRLNMELRRDLFLMFKEVINNICKHAQATQVSIRVGLEKKRLYLVISDNGVGFDTTVPTHRNGLKGLHTRISKWKGDIDIRSREGEGTTIRVALPA